MNNTEKLLRAFIEAQGFDVEEVQIEVPILRMVTEEKSTAYAIDYKVTKKFSDHGLEHQLVMNIIELSKLEKPLRWIKCPKDQFDMVINWFGNAAKKQSNDHYYIYDVSVELFNENL